MHYPADFQQGIQVTGQAGGGRQFAEDFVRLQIKHVLRANSGSSMRRLVIVELNLVTVLLLGFVSDQVQKYGVADGQLVPML